GLQTAFEVIEVDSVPHDIALCLYRVAQEALRNVAAHAAAQRVEVRLSAAPRGLELRIADDGKGFDLEEARQRGGLGLIDIDERVRLVGGRLRIETQVRYGTTVIVRVPVIRWLCLNRKVVTVTTDSFDPLLALLS